MLKTTETHREARLYQHAWNKDPPLFPRIPHIFAPPLTINLPFVLQQHARRSYNMGWHVNTRSGMTYHDVRQ
jgi:hypothetical protein